MFDEPLTFSCFGSVETNIDNVSASGDCDGYVYNSSTEVARFDSDGGALNLYDEAGLSLGSLDSGTIGRYLDDLRADNDVIPGVYIYTNQYSPPYREEDVSNAGYYDLEHNRGTALLRVSDTYAFETLPSVNMLNGLATETVLNCQYSGQMDQSSLDEYPITGRNRYLFGDQNRTLSGPSVLLIARL